MFEPVFSNRFWRHSRAISIGTCFRSDRGREWNVNTSWLPVSRRWWRQSSSSQIPEFSFPPPFWTSSTTCVPRLDEPGAVEGV